MLRKNVGMIDRPVDFDIVQTLSAQLMTTPDSSIPESLAEILSGRFKLTWSHYVFLIQIDNDEERRFYEIESAGQRWSFREMKRQFDFSLYERLALSRNRDKVRSLGARGYVIVDSSDVVKQKGREMPDNVGQIGSRGFFDANGKKRGGITADTVCGN